ncbi:MAG: hypothetical protein AAF514_17740 [Verrucomicrobiota bacterium]
MTGGTLIYCLGGGLGHFTRSWAITRSSSALRAPFHYLVSPGISEIVSSAVPPQSLTELPTTAATNADLTEAWVNERISRRQPECLVVDCFPFGIFGELADLLHGCSVRDIRCLHTARRLRRFPPLPRILRPVFHSSLVTEPLSQPHKQLLGRISRSIEAVPLNYPNPSVPSGVVNKETCLVVHSGPMKENLLLLEYAEKTADPTDPILFLTRPQYLEQFPVFQRLEVKSLYPAWPLFPVVKTIVTAGGFNSHRQALPFAEKHHTLKMERRFDDQQSRCRNASLSSIAPEET